MDGAASREERSEPSSTSNSRHAKSGQDQSSAVSHLAGHVYPEVNLYGNARAIFGNVHGDLDQSFLSHANEADRKVLILRNLYYNGMRARGSQISARAGTPQSVEWIWTTTFADWLRSKDPTYWITGQPGSGKSSLMRHLSQSNRTISILEQLGGKWKVLQFYFDFRAGDGTANRTEGMLRTFLHQFIKQVPSVVENLDGDDIDGIDRRSSHELLELLAELLDSCHYMTCAFIDGLDEFRGASSKLLDVIDMLSDRGGSRMKICLASRSEPVFEQRLRRYPHLAVQDRNDESIRFYTNMTWQSQRMDSSARIPVTLSAAIRKKARGNFLWARLAMDLAVQNLLAGRNVEELLGQVGEMPEAVQEMYKLSLERLPQRLKIEAMLLLHMVVSAGGVLELRRLYAGLERAIDTAQLHYAILPIEHDVDNTSRITSLLGSFIDVGPWRDENGHQTNFFGFSLPSRRFEVRGGSPVALRGSISDIVLIKLNHETLQAYFSQNPWLRDTLPVAFNQVYPESFWLRAYANELSACKPLDRGFVYRYGQIVEEFILELQQRDIPPGSTSEASTEKLIKVLQYWHEWTPLLPYAIEGFFDEVIGYCERENVIHSCYGAVINSIVPVMFCALQHFDMRRGPSTFFQSHAQYRTAISIDWTSGFVDPSLPETWSIYPSANYLIPEVIMWHLENGNVLRGKGSARIQLLLTEVVCLYCNMKNDIPLAWRKLLLLLVAQGGRFDTKHGCYLLCLLAQCKIENEADLCDLMVQNASPDMQQGHNRQCHYFQQKWSGYPNNWTMMTSRGDTAGKRYISSLLKLVSCFDPSAQYDRRSHNLYRTILWDRELPTNRMLKFIEALKAGFDPRESGSNHGPSLDDARLLKDSLKTDLESYLLPENHWQTHVHRESVKIVELLEYVESHGGALPTNLDFYEPFNCWTRYGDKSVEVVLGTGNDGVVIHGPVPLGTLWENTSGSPISDSEDSI